MVDTAVGCGEEESSPAGQASLDARSTCDRNTEIRPGPVELIRGQFMRFEYGERLSEQLYGDVVRIAFLRRSPGRQTSPHGRVLGATARARFGVCAARRLEAQGCPAAIDYQWPHIDQPLQSETVALPDDAALHFGVCPSSNNIKNLPVNQKSRLLVE